MSLSNLDQARLAVGVPAAALAVWVVTALRTGKTLWLSRTSAPRMVQRKTDPVAYWSMLFSLCGVMTFFVALALWPQLAK